MIRKILQWRVKQAAGAIALVGVLYLMFRVKYYECRESVLLPKVKPAVVWEFVADFSNMKFLNPTITDFDVLSESGNYDHWKYSVQYSENLSHWPYLFNIGVAEFDITGAPKKDVYYINSVHRTCLFYGHLCLNSLSEFKFTKTSKDEGALCEESVRYECPALLSGFCQREVEYQRRAIMKNLRSHFTSLRRH